MIGWRWSTPGGKAAFPKFGETLADQVLASGCNFLLAMLLIRYLEVGGYGIFVLSWTAVLFLSGLQHALVVAPMLTLVPKRPPERHETSYGTYFVMLIAVAALSALAAGLGAAICAKGYDGIAAPLSAAAFSFLVQDGLRRMLFARLRSREALVVDVVAYVGQVTAIHLGYRAGTLTPQSALWTLAACFLISAVWAAVLLRPRSVGLRECLREWRESWPFSKWLVGTALAQWLTSNIFLVAAGSLLGAVAAGAVRAAQNVVGVTHVLFLALENHVPSRAARLMAEEGRSAMIRYVGGLSLRNGAAAGLLLLAFAAAPGFWLRFLYGPGLEDYAFVLTWFALLYVGVFVATILRFVVRTLEETSLAFLASAVAGIASLAVAFPLVGHWGVVGVMVGLTLAQASALGCLACGLYRVLR